jgi:hypothetical protein
MSEAKHTPGPWIAHPTLPQVLAGYRRRIECWIATVGGGICGTDETQVANTRLIAAAPELLQVLKRALEAAENPGKDYDWTTEAEAAIAKAEGNRQ